MIQFHQIHQVQLKYTHQFHFSLVVLRTILIGHPSKRYARRVPIGEPFKTDIELPTKRVSPNEMTLKEYLDQEEENNEGTIL